VLKIIKKLLEDNNGQAAVEYAVLVGIFGFLGIFLLNYALLILGSDFINKWYNHFYSLKP
jgi:Flp pilus assembly pilin Flp